jgi:catechol 2,3-dioxygenase-like lactoylglutathione lyase family enzyme
MARFDHLGIQVRNLDASRVWYRDVLELTLEMDNPAARFCALKDDADFAIFLGEVAGPSQTAGLGLWLQVDDVDAFCARKAAAGVAFDHLPQKTMWGYGAQLSDPDGHKLYLWDETSMKANG